MKCILSSCTALPLCHTTWPIPQALTDSACSRFEHGVSGVLQVAACVQQIQNDLPKARVVYCSATGVSEVGNMAFMSRLVSTLAPAILCGGL